MEAWNRKPQFGARLKQTKLALKEWNKEVFKNVQKCIKQTKTLIQNIQEMPQENRTLDDE